MSETRLVTACLNLLHLRGIYAWRNNTGVARPQRKDGSRGFVRFGKKGSADILGVMPHDGDRSECPAGYKVFPSANMPGAWRADTIPASEDGFIAPDGIIKWRTDTTLYRSADLAIAACWAHVDRAEGRTPTPARPDHDADLGNRLLSLLRDGYWIVPVGHGMCAWSISEKQGNICPDLPAAIAAAEAHRRERQQPKPVWYCLVPGRGEPRVPHKTESDAVTEAARLAKIERRPVQVLGVVQVVQPDQT